MVGFSFASETTNLSLQYNLPLLRLNPLWAQGSDNNSCIIFLSLSSWCSSVFFQTVQLINLHGQKGWILQSAGKNICCVFPIPSFYLISKLNLNSFEIHLCCSSPINICSDRHLRLFYVYVVPQNAFPIGHASISTQSTLLPLISSHRQNYFELSDNVRLAYATSLPSCIITAPMSFLDASVSLNYKCFLRVGDCLDRKCCDCCLKLIKSKLSLLTPWKIILK